MKWVVNMDFFVGAVIIHLCASSLFLWHWNKTETKIDSKLQINLKLFFFFLGSHEMKVAILSLDIPRFGPIFYVACQEFCVVKQSDF